ncbi:unnamed protein product [Ambrosiozyma monospora]|uniref:Unnamed protein product n=1 Tax=Ambrosiozyma monospora TaxID=43982 RepID=A0A9W6YZF7_AMBMO|nr:unnamed protein product [Ambrosiozyma monospora]
MSQLEREMRTSHKKKKHSSSRSQSKSRPNSQSHSPEQQEEPSLFDSEGTDFNFNKLEELLRKKVLSESPSQLPQSPTGASASSRASPPVSGRASPIPGITLGSSAFSPLRAGRVTLNREESRANSVIGSIIGSDDEDDTATSRANSHQSNTSGSGVRVYDVGDVIAALAERSRGKKLDAVSRQVLLGELFKLIIKPSTGEVVNENDFVKLIGFLKSALSRVGDGSEGDNNDEGLLELLLSLRCCVAYACLDSDEVGTFVIDQLFPLLLGKVFNNNANGLGTAVSGAAVATGDGLEMGTDVKGASNGENIGNASIVSNFIVSYFALMLVVFDDSNCYGLEENVDHFMELAESLTHGQSNEDDILSNSFHGIAVVLTLIHKAGRRSTVNRLVQDTLPRLLTFLGNEYPKKVHNSVAVLIGLMYEIFDYPELELSEDQDEDELLEQMPYYDQDELKSLIVSLSRESSKKVSKRDKKETKSIFREVLKTIERHAILTPDEAVNRRLQLADNNGKLDSDEDSMILSKLKLNKAKNLTIKSWFEYVRLIHLKFVFDSQLSAQYLNNKEFRDLLLPPDDSRRFESSFNDDDDVGAIGNGKKWETGAGKLSGVKKELKIKHARDAKLRERMEDLELN